MLNGIKNSVRGNKEKVKGRVWVSDGRTFHERKEDRCMVYGSKVEGSQKRLTAVVYHSLLRYLSTS